MRLYSPIIHQQTASLPFYITQAATDFFESGIERKNGFEEYQIMQCVGGEGEFICQNKTYSIRKNDIVIFSPFVPHKYYPYNKPKNKWMLNWLCFLTNGNNIIIKQLTDHGHCVLSFGDSLDLSREFNKIISLFQISAPYNQMQASVVLYKMIIEIVSKKHSLYSTANAPQFLTDIINYMEQHISEVISIEQLAEQADVSVSYLCRKFKEFYHHSPIKILINMRMMKARELLITKKEMKISKVASVCGYFDVSYFCFDFKRYFKSTPSEYRSRY